jgi:endogenous inhibitor of DNA gyrase (YacG/DUF329 family)
LEGRRADGVGRLIDTLNGSRYHFKWFTLPIENAMIKVTCAVCGAEFEGAYINRQYCSARCKSKAWRAKKKAELASQAPRYDALESGLKRALPQAGAKAAELRARAGDECTELIFELVATVLHEMRAGAPKANGKAEGERARSL